MARILVADDESDIRELLKELLENAGHVVMTAQDGEEAFSLYEKGRFDIGIFDVDMPRMNGLDLTKKIKAAQPEFPIILITAYSHLYNASEVLLLGIEAFLRKPVNIKQILELVDQVKSS
ncbi:MAG: response regulator [Calditrichia bacterium]